MRQHERAITCRTAECGANEALEVVRKKHDLTHIEWLRMVNAINHSALQSYFKFELRIERHGNLDTPGDLAGTGKKSPVRMEFVQELLGIIGDASENDADCPDYLFDALKDRLDEEFGE